MSRAAWAREKLVPFSEAWADRIEAQSAEGSPFMRGFITNGFAQQPMCDNCDHPIATTPTSYGNHRRYWWHAKSGHQECGR